MVKQALGNIKTGYLIRADALKFYKMLINMVAPKNGEPIHSANYGRKQIGHIRQSYADNYNQIGEFDRLPPFDKLTFKDVENKRQPSFSADWIKQKILVLSELSNLNNSVRAVIFIVIETGAR